MSDARGKIRAMSVREAIAEAGFEALARADFGAGVAYYRARRLGPRSGEPGREALLRLVVGREARAETAAARLDHPNVLRCDGARHAPGFRALVFEPFHGRSLARELSRRGGRIDPRRTVAIGIQLARALGHAHAAGVVHGNICPENVALGAVGAVKLVGFGASGLPSTPSEDGDLSGLGAALLRALAGAEPAPPPAGEDAALVTRILERCMRLRPELGFYPDARALEAALEGAARRLGEPRADMTGRFAAEELAGILQMLELGRRSGRLELASADGAGGAVAFHEGKIVGARAGGETGRAAVQRLLALPAGRFRLWYGRAPEPPPAGALQISEALLESLRRRDETSRRTP